MWLLCGCFDMSSVLLVAGFFEFLVQVVYIFGCVLRTGSAL